MNNAEILEEYEQAIADARALREGWERMDLADADPWVNGRYALAALVWGLIAIVVLGLGAGP